MKSYKVWGIKKTLTTKERRVIKPYLEALKPIRSVKMPLVETYTRKITERDRTTLYGIVEYVNEEGNKEEYSAPVPDNLQPHQQALFVIGIACKFLSEREMTGVTINSDNKDAVAMYSGVQDTDPKAAKFLERIYEYALNHHYHIFYFKRGK
jgi:hypothetical protein